MAWSSEARALATANSASTCSDRVVADSSAAFSAAISSGRGSAGLATARIESQNLAARSPKMRSQASSRATRPEGVARVPPIDPVQHIAELSGRNAHHSIARRWPQEAALFKTLGIERHADAVVPKDLDQVTAGATEHVEIARVWIPAKRLLHLQRQAVHAAPHIGPPDRQPNPHTRWE